MKKRIAVLLTGVAAASVMLAGCSGSKGLETDEMTISVYKGVEINEVAKPGEVTDEDVENAIQATLQTNATPEEITDRAVESGDTATIDFTGKINGEEFDGGSSTVQVHLSRVLKTAWSDIISEMHMTGRGSSRTITIMQNMRVRMLYFLSRSRVYPSSPFRNLQTSL